MKTLLMLCALVSGSALATSQIDPRGLEEEKVISLQVSETDVAFMKEWGIDKEEYQRYQYLKNSTPRGYFTPGNNPIYYLGIEARTEQERQKYARIIAQMEFENVIKVQSFTKAVQLASVELYGRGEIAEYQTGKAFSEKLVGASKDKLKQYFQQSNFDNKLAMGKRIYVKPDCTPCEREYKRAYADLLGGRIMQIQVVFPEEDTDVIVPWATKMEVPRDLNQQGVIVLRGMDESEAKEITKWPTSKSQVL